MAAVSVAPAPAKEAAPAFETALASLLRQRVEYEAACKLHRAAREAMEKAQTEAYALANNMKEPHLAPGPLSKESKEVAYKSPDFEAACRVVGRDAMVNCVETAHAPSNIFHMNFRLHPVLSSKETEAYFTVPIDGTPAFQMREVEDSRVMHFQPDGRFSPDYPFAVISKPFIELNVMVAKLLVNARLAKHGIKLSDFTKNPFFA